MKLTVKEQERLIMFNVAEVSRRRWNCLLYTSDAADEL